MSKISEKIEEFITPIVNELGYEIVEVEFAKKYGYKSCRAVAVEAINEFMLRKEMCEDGEC